MAYPSIMETSYRRIYGAGNPEAAGREAGLAARAREKADKERQRAEVLAKYGASSKEFGDFLASERATYDPRRGF